MCACDLNSLKRDEVSDFIQFNTQFQWDKPQIFKLSRKTGYNEQSEGNSLLHSKSQLRLHLIVALSPIIQQTFCFARIRASKYLHTEHIFNESRTEIIFTVKSYIFLQIDCRSSRWNFQIHHSVDVFFLGVWSVKTYVSHKIIKSSPRDFLVSMGPLLHLTESFDLCSVKIYFVDCG